MERKEPFSIYDDRNFFETGSRKSRSARHKDTIRFVESVPSNTLLFTLVDSIPE